MKKTIILIAIGFGLSLCFASIGTAEETIKIAAIFSKTGAAMGETGFYETVALGVEEINNKGGVLGRKIEVIELDNKSTSAGSIEAANTAIKSGVAAVIGASWSTHSLAMAPVLQKAGVPMITPVSTNPKVTLVGDYIFRVCFTDPFQGKVMAVFAQRDLNAKTAVILTNINDDYSIGLSEFFRNTAVQGDLKIVWQGKYQENDSDFTDTLQKVKTLNPDVIFLPGHDKDSAMIIRQARKMGITSIFLGADGWSLRMYEIGGKAINGAYASSYWHPEVSFPRGKHLQKIYHDKYNQSVTNDLPLAYDAILVLADAIECAGSLEHKKIRNALAATKDFEGATGTITFDKNRDPINKDAVILKFEDGKTVFVKSIKP